MLGVTFNDMKVFFNGCFDLNGDDVVSADEILGTVTKKVMGKYSFKDSKKKYETILMLCLF